MRSSSPTIPPERRTNEDLRTGTDTTIKGGATISDLLVPAPCPLLFLTFAYSSVIAL